MYFPVPQPYVSYPGEQSVQIDIPDALNVPGEHWLHADIAEPALNVPAGHPMHAEDPRAALMVPGSQFSHLEDPVSAA